LTNVDDEIDAYGFNGIFKFNVCRMGIKSRYGLNEKDAF